MGGFLVLVGLVVMVVAVLVAAADLPVGVLSATVLVAALAVLALALALSRFVVLVRLDEIGYQVRFLRGAGVKQARWSDLEDVVTGFVKNQAVVVIRLRDGRTTTIPVNLLEGSAEDFAKDIGDAAKKGFRRT
jgi:hypothetical protein